MNSPPPGPRVVAQVDVDPGMIGGVYANGLNVWHSPYEFTLDFVVNAQAPQQVTDPTGEQVIAAPQKVVARVRIPPGVVFDIIRAINDNLTNYEHVFGQITRRGDGPPLYPPAGPGDA